MYLFPFRQFKSTRSRRILDPKKHSGYVQGARNIYGERSVKKNYDAVAEKVPRNP